MNKSNPQVRRIKAKKANYKLIFLLGCLILLAVATLSLQKYRKDRSKSVKSASSIQLLSKVWHLTGNKIVSEATQTLPKHILDGKNTFKITYDLHGLCVSPGQASAIELIGANKKVYSISFSDYGQNCENGQQTIDVPLSSFIGLDAQQPVEQIRATFWYPTFYSVDITNIVAYNSGSAVLGISTDQKVRPSPKKFPHITPIRPSPYAAVNLPE